MPVICVKSAPGCFVASPPSLIGSPVAFFPLPRPHFEASALAVSSAAVAPSPPPAASSSESPHAAAPTLSAANIATSAARLTNRL